MGITLFLTLVFLHIALGLALAFLVMYFAFKTEHKGLKNFGFVVGYLLTMLAVLSLILGSIFVAKKPHLMPCPYMQEKMKYKEMIEHGMPMMQEQKDEDNEENSVSDAKQIKKENNGCPVKTKEQTEKDLEKGIKTGAACRAD